MRSLRFPTQNNALCRLRSNLTKVLCLINLLNNQGHEQALAVMSNGIRGLDQASKPTNTLQLVIGQPCPTTP